MKCPCGSGAPLDACCGRFHAGLAAPTAEALMRSRYSAYALGRWDYLQATQTAPLEPGATLAWVKLTVHAATEDEVEFSARYLDRDREVTLHERSKFERRDGRWLYTGGAPSTSVRRLGRNDPCPCDSGKKLKACHGANG